MTSKRQLKHLNACDAYRDGGSFGAAFTTVDGTGYSLWLERHPRIFDKSYSGPRHHCLYEHWDWDFPPPESRNLPIISGSSEEKEILDDLATFIKDPVVKISFGERAPEKFYLEKLDEMRQCIQDRDIFGPEDLPAHQLFVENHRNQQISRMQQAEIQRTNQISSLSASLGESDQECQFAACGRRALNERRLCAEHLV